ncbi:MAG: cell division protein ZapE [Pseudomonadota bacterium]
MIFTFDARQQILLHDVQRHLTLMCADGTRKSVLSLFTQKPTQSGIYIYGDVGRGKTTLMNHVYDQLHVTKKRYHCDTFFTELHRMLQSKDIDSLAQDISHTYRVIWIDELQIYDIATAMLLRRLIPALIEQHVIILMTGNVAPSDFYKDGLNHEQFNDFIPYFNQHFYCLPLNGTIDYRTRPKIDQSNDAHINKKPQQKAHFWLASEASTIEMKEVFESFAAGTPTIPFTLHLNHRTWALSTTHPSAVFIDFPSLAETTCAFDDYRALAQTFPTVFVADVPIFNHTNRDACRRFMAFIDIVYDCGTELYMSAQAVPDMLYQDAGNKLPFARTASRLAEIL